MADSRHNEISRLELLFAAHPEGRVFTHLAEAYRRAGEPERARLLLEAGLARHADYASAHVVHGRVLLDLGLEAEAEAAFRRVLGLDPENLVALRALGDLARRAGRAAEALGYYEQVRRRDPTNPEVEEAVAALAAVAGEAAASAGGEAAGSEAEEAAADGGVVVATAVAPEAEAAAAGFAAADDVAAARPAVAVVDDAADPATAAGVVTADPADPVATAEAADAEAADAFAGATAEAADPAAADAIAEVEEAGDPATAGVTAEAADATDPAAAAAADAPAGPPAVAEVPRADAAHDVVAFDETALLGGEMVTETLADLYLSQGFVERAAELYRQLLIMRPGDRRLMARLEEALAAQAPRNGQHAGPAAAGAGQPQPEEPGDAAGAAPGDPEPVVVPEPDEEVSAEASVGLEPEADRLAEVEAAWTGGAGLGTEDVSPYTWQEEAGADTADRPAEPTIRSYFDALMGWEPSVAPAAPGEPGGARTAAPGDVLDSLFTPATPTEALPPRATPAPEMPPAEAGPAPDAGTPEPTAASGVLVGLADLLVGLLEYQDPSMPGGSSMVRQVATAIGRELGMADPPLRSLALAAVLQGLGRLALRDRTGTAAAGPAEPDARALEVTLELLDGHDLPTGVREAIAYAYHRWDGADGAKPAGTAIPLSARILGVARDFTALLAPSAVAHSRRVGAALDELKREAGRRYDPAVVATLVRLVGSQARVGFGLRHHVLIVHRHSPTAAVLAARLRSNGYLPEAVDDFARAWERLAAAPADALLLADDVAGADTPRFLSRLREDPALGGIPVVVAGADSLDRRVELLNAGADICFPPDASFNELRATLMALLRRAARPGAAAAAARKATEHARRYALQGDLVDFPLTWLLDILAFDGRTAVVSVSTPDDEGTVHVERGTPRHAETRSRYGEAALRAMLRWRYGSFSVHLDAPPAPHTIQRSVMELLVADGLAQDAARDSHTPTKD